VPAVLADQPPVLKNAHWKEFLIDNAIGATNFFRSALLQVGESSIFDTALLFDAEQSSLIFCFCLVTRQLSGVWQKTRVSQGQEFVIGGHTPSDKNASCSMQDGRGTVSRRLRGLHCSRSCNLVSGSLNLLGQTVQLMRICRRSRQDFISR
jgi:hypothetical protein